MKRIRFGILAGIVFAILDVLPMAFMDLPDKPVAITGAFIERFAIGFLIPNVSLPWGDVANGAVIGILLSLPSAIITGTYGPILGTGLIGGLIIGLLTKRFCAPRLH